MARELARELAVPDPEGLVFGVAPRPVATRNGLSIGGGLVYPELNFTLPPMLVEEATMADVLANYKEMADGVCRRAEELAVPGFVVEIETLPPMTFNPAWAVSVTRTVVDAVEAATVPGAVRITPNDIREGRELEHMWRGTHWDAIMATFAGCAEAGAELLAIESVGGKEVHDEATMFCDLAKSVFALAVLGTRDMERLWTAISGIAGQTGTVPAGDTACGFANTAMVLAEKNYIPRVFAATVRAVAAVRSLVAVECGARGPHKACGDEGVYVKAITGIPVSLEGATAACAHFSPVGNIAACAADLWSNESVQNIKLLAGPAPTDSFEQLAYDCRLLNAASARGRQAALLVRDLHAESDAPLDPQAYVLRPDVAVRIATAIVEAGADYDRGKAAARQALAELRQGHAGGELALDDKELMWLDKLSADADALPDTAEQLAAEIDCDAYDPAKYDL
jgi:methanol--5-hydroxybenzimidazolylcobamide Co-methyltransferase